jgi:hypothetical protein
MDNKLPPLPPSDQKSLEHNSYARDFWKDNRVTRLEDIEMNKCIHEFIPSKDGAECKKCHFGLIGPLEVRSGKLFFQGGPVGL